jgi:DNA-binding NarL/FixJ family response regulator
VTRILIVDDNARVRAALRLCLKMKEDWVVCGEAEDGDAAIELVRTVKPDVVLLDYAMPVMNGLEAARVLSGLAPECAILMYTMFATPQLSELASAAGVRAVLSKDVNGIGAVWTRSKRLLPAMLQVANREAYSIRSGTGRLIPSGYVNHRQPLSDEARPLLLQLRILCLGLLQDGVRRIYGFLTLWKDADPGRVF